MINTIKQYKPRVILSLLLIFHISLISLQVKNLEGTSLLKTWLINVNAPVIHITESTSQGLKRFWKKYIYLKGLYDENQALQQEVARLKLQIWKDAEIASENKRLAELVQLKERLTYPVQSARVVIKKPSFFSHTVFIDKGSNHGLKKYIPVISAEGVVGHITSASQTLSEVQLLTNPGAAANAVIETRGVQGIINGTGDEWLSLRYVPIEEKVEPGDPVITAGMDGIYPKGLPIGTVVDVRPGPSIYKDIKVKPATDIWRLEAVLLLMNK